jgi:hypothetical protein
VDEQVLPHPHPVEVLPGLRRTPADCRLEHFDAGLASSENVKAVAKFDVGVLAPEDINALVLDLFAFSLSTDWRFLLVEIVLLPWEEHRHHLVLGKALAKLIRHLGNGQFKPEFLVDV